MDFIVDTQKCDHCGRCSAECPVLIIDGKTEFPTIKEGKEGLCLKCQHCLAICPHGAISIWGKDPVNSIAVNTEIPSSKEMENLMKTRRSIRRFRQEEVERDLIYQLISSASYAPTAQNINAVQFTVVDNREDMLRLRKLSYARINQANKEGRIPQNRKVLKSFLDLWQAKEIDVLFRNAPHLLVTSAPERGSFSGTDGVIAMSYFDLLAASCGIGTLWDGFAQWVIDEIAPELKEEIGIPGNHVISAVLIFGRPAVKFTRSIQNDSPNISKVF